MGRPLAVAAVSAVITGPVAGASAQGSAPDPVLVVLVKGVAIAIVAAVVVYSARCLARPGGRDSKHIKHRILRDDG